MGLNLSQKNPFLISAFAKVRVRLSFRRLMTSKRTRRATQTARVLFWLICTTHAGPPPAAPASGPSWFGMRSNKSVPLRLCRSGASGSSRNVAVLRPAIQIRRKNPFPPIVNKLGKSLSAFPFPGLRTVRDAAYKYSNSLLSTKSPNRRHPTICGFTANESKTSGYESHCGLYHLAQ